MEFQVEVEFKGDILKGILINETEEFYVLKLSSGYNANLDKKNAKILKKEEFNKNNSISKNDVKKNTNLPKIVILHTGGTIASKVDYRTGAVSSKFTAEELVNLFPELKDKVQIEYITVSNIFSEDLRFAEYNKMLEYIQNLPNDVVGAIISHGTDTMHYSAAALHYGILNLSVPIILVGAQRSSDRASSDSYSNLNAAVDFILKQKDEKQSFRRVGICMHENISDNNFIILDGVNAKKMHSTRRDAFKQINYLPFARLVYDNGNLNDYIEFRPELKTLKSNEKIKITKYNENLKIGFFKVHPNVFQEELGLLKYYDAVVVEGTGIGNVPESVDNQKQDGKLLIKFKEISKNTKLIPAVQTVSGEVSLDIYSRGRDIQNSGFIGNRMNLISETLFIRTAHLLSLDMDKFEENWIKNLEGFEIRNEDQLDN